MEEFTSITLTLFSTLYFSSYEMVVCGGGIGGLVSSMCRLKGRKGLEAYNTPFLWWNRQCPEICELRDGEARAECQHAYRKSGECVHAD